jgi:peroxiredoxin
MVTRILRACLLLPVLVLIAVACEGKSKESANKAPDFKLAGLDGKSYSMADFKGKVILLDFWATWCGPCRMEVPHLKDLHAAYSEKGLAIVGVSVDQHGAAAVRPFVEKNQIPFVSLLADEAVVRAYGNVTAIPTTFLIDKKGNIQKVYRGYTDKHVFEEDVKKLL